MFVVVINKFEGGVLEVNGPYERYNQAEWFIDNCVPYAWKEFSEIKNITKPEYERY